LLVLVEAVHSSSKGGLIPLQTGARVGQVEELQVVKLAVKLIVVGVKQNLVVVHIHMIVPRGAGRKYMVSFFGEGYAISIMEEAAMGTLVVRLEFHMQILDGLVVVEEDQDIFIHPLQEASPL
jgi:hypothetical protein